MCSLAAVFCVSALTTAGAQKCVDDTQEVKLAEIIPDKALLSAITTALATPAVTCKDVRALTELDAPSPSPSRMITSLTGLDYFIGIGSLDLSNNAIRDSGPLRELVDLTDLHLQGNFIDDLAPLLANVQSKARRGISFDLTGNCLDLSDNSNDAKDRDALIRLGVRLLSGSQRRAAECTRP
jgi:hypothetical protein